MAVFLPGGGVASIRGSIGGSTFSANRGGPYMRNRSIPTNPNTPQQQAVRSAMALLAARWGDTLTDNQRAQWDLYAENVLLLNSLGQPRNVGGIGMYVRSNIPRIQNGVAETPIVDDGPSNFTLGEYTQPTIASITASTGILSLVFDPLDDWANEDEAALLIFTSKAKSPSTNYFKGPYNLAGVVLGSSATAPTSPASITLASPAEVGQQIFIRGEVSRVDGRLSADFRGGGIAI